MQAPSFSRWRNPLVAVIVIMSLLMAGMSVMAAPTEDVLRLQQGGNEDCPAGTIEVAKFETNNGGAYVLEGDNDGNVQITNADLSGGDWTADVFIAAIVVKGGNDATIDSVNPPAQSGTFSNANVPTVGQGNIPDISNIKFCAADPQPEPETGSITIVKDVIYDADVDIDSDRDFGFFSTELGNFTLDDPLVDDADGISNTTTFNDLTPGEYTITENPNGNWNQSVLCVGDAGVQYVNPGTGATVNLDAGEDVTCTFTNERVTYELTYEKVLADGTPALDGDWEFTLASLISLFEGTIDQDFGVVTTIDGSGGTSTLTLPLDAYKVGEIVPAGYDLQLIDCGGGGTSVSPPLNDQFTILLDQDLTCTFTNVEEEPETYTLRMIKYNDLDGEGDNDEINTSGVDNTSGYALTGWEFVVYDSQGNEVGRNTTSEENAGANGDLGIRASIPGLISGEEYTICETQQEGWINTEPGTIDPTYGEPCETVTLTGSGPFTRYFGNYEEEPQDLRLNLTAECAVGDTLYWRVTNDNDVDVDFTVRNRNISGTATANSRTYFTTQDGGGTNTTIIDWTNPAGSPNSKTKAHNNNPCVYHVTFDKVWEGADAPDLDGATLLTAESSLGTATCTSDDGNLSCVYSTGDDLHVPFGEEYTVTENTNILPEGWSVIEGVGSGFTGIEGFDESALPDALVYDVADDRFCESDPNADFPFNLEKFCEHTVVNEYEEPPQDLRLNLTAECVVGDTLYWRVTNDNDVDVDFTVRNRDISGTATANSRTYFTTQDGGGTNTTIIDWNNPGGNNDSKTKAHNNNPCVYHVTFDKQWDGADAPDLDGATLLTAESSLGTATCTSDDGNLSCVYSTGDDLHVPFGETYTVNENLPEGWTAIEGVGSDFTGIEGFDESALPNDLVYDVAGDRFCENDPNADFPFNLEKFCEHTVVNEYEEPEGELRIIKQRDTGIFSPDPAQAVFEACIYDSEDNLVQIDGEDACYELNESNNWRTGFIELPIGEYTIRENVDNLPAGWVADRAEITVEVESDRRVDRRLRNIYVEPQRPSAEVCLPLNQLGFGADTSIEGELLGGLIRVETNGGDAQMVATGGDFAWVANGTTNNYSGGESNPDFAIQDRSFEHDYVFTFSEDIIVTEFSVRVYDFGDYNPARANDWSLSLNSPDTGDTDGISFSGNIGTAGDAFRAIEGQPGNRNYAISADNGELTIVNLDFDYSGGNSSYDPSRHGPIANPNSADPYIGLDELCITYEDFEPGRVIVNKYNDLNGDGNRQNYGETPEPGIQGWEFRITGPEGFSADNRTTGARGYTTFSDLPQGEYEICEIMQDGWTNSTPLCQTIVIDESGETERLDFGNYEVLPPADTCGAVEVVSFEQGNDRNGNPIVDSRSNPEQALGAPQMTDTINFVSLGFGGELILQLDGMITDDNGSEEDIYVVETSYGDPSFDSYPESATLYGSMTPAGPWTELGTLQLDTGLDFPGDGLSIQYVRFVDTSDTSGFRSSVADGYDVDGILCEEPDGTIRVTKRVDWNGAEVDRDQYFTLCVDGDNLDEPLCETVNYDGGSVSFDVEPGRYSVYELDPGDNWNVAGQRHVTVEPAETDRVTITNTHDEPTGDLTIVKLIEWNGAEINNAVTFEICVDGEGCRTASVDNNYSVTWYDLPVGDYHFSETYPGDQWTVEYLGGQTATVSADGENVYYVRNTHDEPRPEFGSVSITKVVDWNNVNPDPNQMFTLCLNGGDLDAPLCDTVGYNGGTVEFGSLTPGETYNAYEHDPGSQWTASGGGHVTVVANTTTAANNIHNRHAAPPPPPPPVCEGVGPQSDLSGYIEIRGGEAIGYVTNNGDEACHYPIGLVSYNMPYRGYYWQTVHDSHVATVEIQPGATVELRVELPDCATQVDLFYGDLIAPMLGNDRYGSRLLAWVWHDTPNWCPAPDGMPEELIPGYEPPVEEEQPPVEENEQPPVDENEQPPVDENEQPPVDENEQPPVEDNTEEQGGEENTTEEGGEDTTTEETPADENTSEEGGEENTTTEETTGSEE